MGEDSDPDLNLGIFKAFRDYQKNKSLLVSSTYSGEGKTTVSLNTALAFSKIGKVLLIETDTEITSRKCWAIVNNLKTHSQICSHLVH